MAETSLLLKRPVTIKVIVTPRWKEEAQQAIQAQINQLDGQIQQLELQGQRAISEIQKQSLMPLPDQAIGQIDNIKMQVNQKKSEFLERKNQALQQLQQVQLLDFDQEVVQTQIDGFCKIKMGENLVNKMNLEIVLRDGIVEEIRGEI
jgi:hypothetical protein